MPTERLIAALRVAGSPVRSTLKPLEVLIQRVTAKKEDVERLPYTDEGAPPPSAPNVWLQVWEIDSFEKVGHRSAVPDDSPPSDTNDFLVEIPGYIQKVGQGAESSFELRILGAPVCASGDPLGWFHLAIKDARGQPWSARLPIVGEAEAEVDFACVLEKSAGKRAHATGAFARGVLLHAVNMSHLVGSMVAEGGLTCIAFGALNTEEQRRKHDELRRAVDERLKAEPQKKEPEVVAALLQEDPWFEGAGGKALAGEGSVAADEEFRLAAERMVRAYHSAGLLGGELMNAAIPFTGLDALAATLGQIRDKVHADYQRGEGEKPKVKRLVILTAGDPAEGLRVGPGPGDFARQRTIAAAAPKLAEHLTKDALVSLLAGGTGLSPTGHDVHFGLLPAEGHSVGEGSFADELRRALAAAGLDDAAVWAPTLAGHPTGNHTLRAFTKAGSIDVIWLIEAPSNRRKQVELFDDKNQPKPIDDVLAPIVRTAISHPGSAVGPKLARAYPPPDPANAPPPEPEPEGAVVPYDEDHSYDVGPPE